MVQTTTCPDVEQWKRLLGGQLPEQEAEVLEHHLSECAACLQTVRETPAEDTLADALRSRPDSAVERMPPTVDGLISRLKALHLMAADSVLEETVDTTPPEAAAAHMVRQTGDLTEEAYDFLAPAQRTDELGRLGSYRVLKVLGVGGMGVVFEAEDTTLKRRVALKAMKPALAASDTARLRFVREAQATAALDHDHIVHIYQVGEDRGVPFLAMQFLKGRTLEERLRRGQALPVADVLRIGRETAEGLAAAHESGLIHRDIKPSNIWLEGPRERVKILDFGLARAATDNVHLTQPGAVAGTPAYMAPEQARGEAIDARCDLFSLGCVLYRLCTGQAPFKGDNTMSLLLALAQDHPKPPRELNPAVPAPLSDLVMALLSKDPAGRPPTAEALVRTIEAMERERPAPVAPEATGTHESLPPAEKKRRRWPTKAVAIAAVLVIGILLWGATVVLRTKDGTLTVTTSEPDAKVYIDGEERIVIDSSLGGKIVLTPGKHRITIKRGDEEVYAEEFTLTSGGDKVVHAIWEPKVAKKPDDKGPEKIVEDIKPPVLGALGWLGQLDAKKIPAEDRFDWQPKELVAVVGEHRQRHWAAVADVAWSADGKLVASAGVDRVVHLWDAATMRHRDASVPRGTLGVPMRLSFSPDSKILAVTNSAEQNMRLYDVTEGKLVDRLAHPIYLGGLNVAWSADGTLAACLLNDGVIHLWDLTGEKRKERLALKRPSKESYAMALSPDGKLLAEMGNKTVRLWDVSGKEPQALAELKTVTSINALAFSPDGKRLMGASLSSKLHLWDVDGANTREVPMQPFGTASDGAAVNALAWSAHNQVAIAHNYGVTLWDFSGPPTRKGVLDETTLKAIKCVAFSPDGKTLCTGGIDGAVRLWDLTGAKPAERFPLRGHSDAILSLNFSADDRTLLTAGADSTVRLWNLSEGRFTERKPLARPYLVAAILAPDEKAVALSCYSPLDKPGVLWDLTRENPGERLRISPGALLACANNVLVTTEGANVRRWDLQVLNPRELPALNSTGAAVTLLAYAPDGKWLATDGEKVVDKVVEKGHIRLWDLRGPTPKMHLLPTTTKKAAAQLAFSADSQTLAVKESGEKKMQVYELTGAAPALTAVIELPILTILDMAFSPDGKTFAASDSVGKVHLLEVRTWKLTRTFEFPNIIRHLTFSHDGHHLALGTPAGMVYVLRLVLGPMNPNRLYLAGSAGVGATLQLHPK